VPDEDLIELREMSDASCGVMMSGASELVIAGCGYK
jgi:hypothetical protein